MHHGLGSATIGLVTGLGRLAKSVLIRAPLRAYVELFRCTPVLVQLIWFYYALPILTGIDMSAATAAVLALSLYGGAFYSEIVRAGVISIDAGQTEAGMAIGMTRAQVMRRVILPQAFKRMVPPADEPVHHAVEKYRCFRCSRFPTCSIRDNPPRTIPAARSKSTRSAAICYFVVLLPATIISQRLETRLAKQDNA